MNALELTGRTGTHVRRAELPECTLHADVIVPFSRLQWSARAAGFELKPVSSFRDFDRQLRIWNAKYRGDRPLYDTAGRPMVAASLTPAERVAAILHWSALPGASRHHWGTDVDVIDANAAGPDHEDQLTTQKFAPGGPFAPLSDWLESNAPRFGFFRPYRGVLSGVQAEPWHFSFAPVAEHARRALRLPILEAALAQAPLLGKENVVPRLPELHRRYVDSIDWP